MILHSNSIICRGDVSFKVAFSYRRASAALGCGIDYATNTVLPDSGEVKRPPLEICQAKLPNIPRIVVSISHVFVFSGARKVLSRA
jgi:hypothetical protein